MQSPQRWKDFTNRWTGLTSKASMPRIFDILTPVSCPRCGRP